MKLIKSLFPCLAIIAIQLISISDAYHPRHIICFLDQSDCGSLKILNEEKCVCECPTNYTESDCYKNEIWDKEFCTCYCPFEPPILNPNPEKMYWSRSRCNFVCTHVLKCEFGTWNTKTCSCPDPPALPPPILPPPEPPVQTPTVSAQNEVEVPERKTETELKRVPNLPQTPANDTKLEQAIAAAKSLTGPQAAPAVVDAEHVQATNL